MTRGTGVARQRWGRAGLIAAAAALIGGIAVAGTNEGNPAQDVRLRSGAAWLSSAKVGQVTLLDGSSAEVSAQVQVAPAGNALDVVQQGSTAYAIDQSAGTIRRVDGATFDLTAPESPIPDARAGLTALPGPDALYTLDGRRGILANTDPRSLARRGELLSLASELSAGTATVDESGTLWAIDTSTGDLTRVAGGKRSTRPQVTSPGPSILTIVGGHPVVVDVNARKAISIDRANGKPGSTLNLDLRKDDTVAISGSPHAERLYVVAGRGNLSICDLAAGQCGNAIPLTAGNRFGAAVEAGNRLFVPDNTTGQVWVVDLTDSRVIAKPTVLAPAGPFQLLTRDGVVFYNDPNSAQAGVIHLDGTLSKTTKYNADDPSKGVHIPNNTPTPPQQTPPNNPQQPPPNNPQQPDTPINQPNNPQQPPNNPPPNNPPPNNPPPNNPPPNNPPPNNPPPNNPPPNNPPPQNPPPAEPKLEVVVSNANPTVDQPITLQVKNTTGTIPNDAVVEWSFGDGATGSGITTSHKWAAAKQTPYDVSVKVTFPDSKTALASVNITVSEKPTVKLTVSIPSGGGTITGDGGINCAATCEYNLAPDTAVTLTAQPDSTHIPGTWGGACTKPGTTCDITMNTAKTVSYAFPVKEPIVTLTVTYSDHGTVKAPPGIPISCGGNCKADVNNGTKVKLTAEAWVNYDFVGWTGACAGTSGPVCDLTMIKDETIAAVYQRQSSFLVHVEIYNEANAGTVNVGGTLCKTRCDVRFNADVRIVIEATTDNPGVVFERWFGECLGTAPRCEVLVDGQKSLAATFKPA